MIKLLDLDARISPAHRATTSKRIKGGKSVAGSITVKICGNKMDKLNSIPRIHMVKGESHTHTVGIPSKQAFYLSSSLLSF